MKQCQYCKAKFANEDAYQIHLGIGAPAFHTCNDAEELRSVRQHISQGFDQAHAFVQERFTEINARFDKVEQRLDALSSDVNELKDTVSQQGKRLDTVDSKLDQILTLLQQKPEI
jgi:prefoldin subunit 5